MSWIQALYETYQKNASIAGLDTGEGSTLLPIFHANYRAHIEVILNQYGEMVDVLPINPSEESIIIPCTESSASRSGSMPAAHPLNDKLQYLAKDYPKYGTKWHGYDKYIKLIDGWAEYPDASNKVKLIAAYVKGSTLITDLIDKNIMKVEDGALSWGERVVNSMKIDPEDAVIRWTVEEPGVMESRTWKDTNLFGNWISYYLSTKSDRGFCYVLGEEGPLESKHPKKIYSNCANAKIISSNDGTGYTYRGRFTNPQQSYGLSCEASQKAHNALTWLITRQGYNKDKKTIVCWATSGQDIPKVTEDAYGLWDLSDSDEISDDKGNTAMDLSHRLRMKIAGYGSSFTSKDKVNLMELESVTDGRLSITYFRSMDTVEFLDRLDKWHLHCQWIHRYYAKKSQEDKGKPYFVGVPSPMNIAETVYGTKKNVDEKLKLKTVDRILMCIFDGDRIPQDLIQMSVRRVANREAFDEEWEYEKALSITCALLKKYYFDYKEEIIEMALDKERSTRDYLFGRLLAVAQNTEQWALQKSGEKRMTNADRLMNRFSTHPFSTWQIIEMNLKPYLEKLNGGAAASRENLIDEIMSLFDPDSFIDDRALTGEFLLGYHCQREDLRKKKEISAELNENENENGGIES